jgi:fructokinase
MIYTAGEILLDIIIKTFNDVKIKPGGSLLNTAISLGRLSVDVSHISFLSNDKASDLLIDFMKANNVNTELINRLSNTKTDLALAFLDENNNADYAFYKDEIVNSDNINPGLDHRANIIYYGSLFSIDPNIHTYLQSILKSCSSACIKMYDPNFRVSYKNQLPEFTEMIEMNFEAADIVKASDEDFDNIFGIKTGLEAWEKMKEFNVTVLFYTKGANGSEFYSAQGSFSTAIDKIKVVSTIGAGDTFSAGIIYYLNSLFKKGIKLNNISIAQWQECVNISHEFSSQTCQSIDNYLSEQYCDTYKVQIKE